MELRIQPAKDRRVILLDGGTALDGTPLVPGARCPDEGAVVESTDYIRRRLDQGDADLLPEPAKSGRRQPAPTADQGGTP